MSLKSVKAMPALSTAAKTTIINTIADNALASFVVIQVGLLACTPSCFTAANQQHVTPPLVYNQFGRSWTAHAVTLTQVQMQIQLALGDTPTCQHLGHQA
jgi:hypothetical protein